ncbi:galactose-specific lectin nattectin-like [Synchiropus splendidus]|uniref:galactose-specific lectin nattectin-like n=1 Tax=Synchiropus splendidus TaxID=270530 RepID=UPI00237E8AFF|nr:galactose-specific lectin nattectin-like [Synchiropus splendidus]
MASGLSFIVVLCGLWMGANARCCDDNEPCVMCPSGWTQFGERCFMYQAAPKDWADAETHCLNAGGNLVSYHSQAEYDFIIGMIRRITGTNQRIWAGGQDTAKVNVWMWSNGHKFNYANWGPGEPNNGGRTEHCMELNWRNKPNDHQCYHKKPFMCAMDLE